MGDTLGVEVGDLDDVPIKPVDIGEVVPELSDHVWVAECIAAAEATACMTTTFCECDSGSQGSR